VLDVRLIALPEQAGQSRSSITSMASHFLEKFCLCLAFCKGSQSEITLT
jgi:hypothetical protein